MSEIKLSGIIDGKSELSTEEIEGLKKLKKQLKSKENLFTQQESKKFLELLEKELGNYFLSKEGGFSLADFRKRKFNDSGELYELYVDIASILGYEPKTQEQINKDYANDVGNINLNFITSGGGLSKEEIRGLYDLNQVLRYSDKIPTLDLELRKNFVKELEKDVSFYLTHSGMSDFGQDFVIGDKYELYHSIVKKLGLTPKTKEELEDKGVNLKEILDGDSKLESQEINALADILDRLSKGELEKKHFNSEEIDKFNKYFTRELGWYLSVGFIKVDTYLKELINTLGKDIYVIYEKLGNILGFPVNSKQQLITDYINKKNGSIYDKKIKDLSSKQQFVANLLSNIDLKDIKDLKNFEENLKQIEFPPNENNKEYIELLKKIYDEVKERQRNSGSLLTIDLETHAKFSSLKDFYEFIDKDKKFLPTEINSVISDIRKNYEGSIESFDISMCSSEDFPFATEKEEKIFALLKAHPKETNEYIKKLEKIEINIDILIGSFQKVSVNKVKIGDKFVDISYNNQGSSLVKS